MRRFSVLKKHRARGVAPGRCGEGLLGRYVIISRASAIPWPPPDAHCNDTFLEAVPTHQMEKSGCQHSACRTDRMTMGNRAAIDIRDVGRQPEFPHDRTGINYRSG
jgi:hypothetical protein